MNRLAISAAVACVLAAGPSAAQMPPPPPGGGPFFIATQKMGMGVETRAVVLAGPSPFMMLLKAANLTPEQQAKVRTLMQSQGEKTAQTTQQLRAVEEQISSRLLSPEPVNAGDLAPLEKQAAQLKQQMDQNMVDTSLGIRNILTTDQLKHLAQVRKQLESLRTQIEALMGPGPDMMYMQAPDRP